MLANLVAPHAENGVDSTPPIATAWAAPDAVLIAEDNDVIANLLALILRRAGYRPLRVRTGAECLTVFEREPDRIAIAILDISLPDTDGVLLGQNLRHRAESLPLLFTSGRDVPALRYRFGADARTGFLRKPFFPPDVLRAVGQLCHAECRGAA